MPLLMIADDVSFELRLALTDRDLRAAQRLRYQVFVTELGGDGPLVDHQARLEQDEFDSIYDHLLLIDPQRNAETLDDVVGVYRLLPGDRIVNAGQFYSESEYDLSALKVSGRKLLELGRSCVHKDYRGSAAMYHLWNGLADYVAENSIEVLFGVASFHGTNVASLSQSLAYLHHYHLAPKALRVRAQPEQFQAMDILPADRVDRKLAMAGMPALIKAYLRFGGFVGDGAWVDHAFNTTDVCLVMDTDQMSDKHKEFYARKQGQKA